MRTYQVRMGWVNLCTGVGYSALARLDR